jgi:hypothetical protein
MSRGLTVEVGLVGRDQPNLAISIVTLYTPDAVAQLVLLSYGNITPIAASPYKHLTGHLATAACLGV